ncbi:MAG: hypothetical protein IPK26_06040 [Planctomycetes bacterium]|nr:hypothetical protein [Planctomycetota bacterium]
MAQPWLEFLGRLHPLALHLPIGLWCGVFALEFGAALLRRPAPRGSVLTLAWLAAITGGLAAATGWLLGDEGEFTAGRLDPHRWAGVAMAGAGLATAIAAGLTSRAPFRWLLLTTMGAMAVAGHLGGNLTHGENFLWEPLQQPAKPEPTPQPGPAAPDSPPTTPPSPPAATTGPAISWYQASIRPILERTCVPCHGEEKQKAELRFDSPEAITAGGENGAVLVAGKPDDSSMLTRLLLPLDHDDHMPPPKKPQPTPEEIEALRAWIAAGAPFTGERPSGG